MSTQFRPLEIPPGVVSNPTKQMRSSNWAEVNLMRWVEGQLTPVGGQAAYTYSFASRCKLIHGWYDLSDVYHIAYLCEANLYVDTGGVLVDITPAGGITPPQPLTEGGYGDGAYGQNVVLAATAAWAPGAANIQMTANPGSVQPGMDVYNTTQNLHVGMVVAFTGGVLSLAAPGAEYAGNAGDILNFDWYGIPRAISDIQALDKVPDAWSLDNFGAILLAMTSPDGRLLQFDPGKGTPGGGGNPTATAAWTTGTTIPMSDWSDVDRSGENVYNTTSATQVGTVASYPTTTGNADLDRPRGKRGRARRSLADRQRRHAGGRQFWSRHRPHRALLRRHQRTFRDDDGRLRLDQRRRPAALRLVRPGELPGLGLCQRHQPGWLSRYRAREPDHLRQGGPARGAVLDGEFHIHQRLFRRAIHLQLHRDRQEQHALVGLQRGGDDDR